MSHIARQFAQVQVTFVANTCESNIIDMAHFAGGLVQMGPSWTTAHLGVKVAIAPTNTSCMPLYDRSETILKITHPLPSYAYPLPDEVYAARCIRLWSVSDSLTNLDQAAERTITLSLKG